MSDSPQSPPKEVEQGVQSPDEEAQMNDPQDPQASGLAYEFEVKEQDRWLPIANGASDSPFCFIVIREGVRCFVHLWFALHGYWLSLEWHAPALPLRKHRAYPFVHVPRLVPKVARSASRFIQGRQIRSLRC